MATNAAPTNGTPVMLDRERLAALTTRELDRFAAAHARAQAAEPDSSARGELVLGSTLAGLFVARDLCQVCSSDREHATVYASAISGAFVLSMLDREQFRH